MAPRTMSVLRSFAMACMFSCLATQAQAQALTWMGLCGANDSYQDGGLAVDEAANLYALVTAKGLDGTRLQGGANAWGVVKFSPRGEKLWTRMWGESIYDFARGAAIAPDGSVYVVGNMIGPAIAKLDGSGAVHWNVHGKKAELQTKDHGSYQTVAVDPEGNAYAAGWDSPGIILVKYSSTGKEEWSRSYGKVNAVAMSVALDRQGNIYLVGRCNDGWEGQPNQGSGDFYLMKCNNAGEKLWVRSYGGPRMDWGAYVAVDPAGNVLAVGYSEHDFSASAYDIKLTKHDPSGNLIYVKDGGTTHFGLNYHGFVHDGHGGLYGTVVTTPQPGTKRTKGTPEFSQFVVKYDEGGERVWSAPFGNGNLAGMGNAAVADAQGFFYTLGSKYDPKTKTGDVCVLKFAPYAPSFDCAKAASPQETMICGSGVLSELDRTLARLYATAKKSLPNAARLKTEQVQWLRAERDRCTTVEQLEKSMNARIEALRTCMKPAGSSP